MDKKEMLRIGGLFEELQSVCQAASQGNGKEPVWDGTAIGKTRLRTLVTMRLVERVKGYYFPTKVGTALFRSTCLHKHGQLTAIHLEQSNENQD